MTGIPKATTSDNLTAVGLMRAYLRGDVGAYLALIPSDPDELQRVIRSLTQHAASALVNFAGEREMTADAACDHLTYLHIKFGDQK